MNKNLETLSALARGELNLKEEHIDHPSHYNRSNSMECIDEMVLIFGREAVMNFCLLNAWKYRYRAADKNGAEDIAKSDWYIAKYKELKESNKCQCNCHKEEPKYMSVPAYERQQGKNN